MIETNFFGRTGNLLLQNIGLSIISKKFDLKVKYYHQIPEIELLGVELYNGKRILRDTVTVFDTVKIGEYGNLMDLLSREDIDKGIYFDGAYQVGDFIKNYQSQIKSHFKLNYIESHKDDLFIHVRLGDVSLKNPGYEYYKVAIGKINYRNIYLSTDSQEHPLIKGLLKEFGNIIIYDNNPIQTIDFAKNFNNLILSKGTFSWWIGFLSRAENIIIPINDEKWYGDIFVFDWTEIDINK